MINILQVITSLLTGGAEHVVLDLVVGLRNKGYRVDLVLFNGQHTQFMDELTRLCKANDAKGLPELEIYRLSERASYYNLLYIPRLRKIMKNYDIIHTHNSSPQLFAAVANIGLNKKLLTTEHTTNNRKREIKYFSFIDRVMYNHYNEVVCISEKAKQKLCNYIGHTTADITVINNGVDVNSFYEAEPDNDLLYSKNGKTAIVMVAGFRESKDQDTLIRAISHLDDKYVLWLVGDGVRKQKLKALVAELNIEEKVKFIGIRSDVKNILKAADIIVMSSHWEGLSLSNVEGMASGKPFIASNVDGLREVTEGAGILFQHGNDKELADIIKHLSTDEVFYRQTAEKCRQRAKKFDVRIMISKYEQLYNSLMDGRTL